MSQSLTAILGTVVAVAVIAAVTVLGWHGTMDGQTVAGLFGAVIGGGAAGATAGHVSARMIVAGNGNVK